MALFRMIRRFSMSLDEIEATVHQVVKNYEKINPKEVTRTVTFQELGLSSLDQMELVADLEEAFSVDISDTDVFKVNTVMDAVSIFKKYITSDIIRSRD